METFYHMLQWLIPDIDKQLYNRFDILQEINQCQPIGRRLLAENLNVSERILRQAIDEMKESGLIDVAHNGMSLTPLGNQVLEYFEDLITEENQLLAKSKQLAKVLNIQATFVSSSNTTENPGRMAGLGNQVNDILSQQLPKGDNVIAVMGGTSVAAVADHLTPQLSRDRELLFISGRGGMGTESSIQANVICDKMAEATKGKSKALYTPDQMSDETYNTLVNEPAIKEILQSIQQANALIFGIGEADTMISRRNFDDEMRQKLKDQQVVGEAFGEYFKASGEVVYRLKRIGLQIEDLEHIPLIIAVASGDEKAIAIEAFMKHAPDHVQLVTDEGAADRILHKVKQ